MTDDQRTTKIGWYGREYWCDGVLAGWIGINFDPETLQDAGYYGQAIGPLRFLVKNVSMDEAIAAVEEAARAKVI